ncbi:MAG TPA: hypothetical protein VLV78_05245 [Thermoanaerobaculia bacterium]|nr:hypothetical protein [Thermoanaerobaculia bacterium]
MNRFLAVAILEILISAPMAADLAPQHIVRLNEAFRIAGVLGPRVWPGFTATDAPVILIDGESEYLLNIDGAAEGFTASAQTFRGRPVYVRPRVFPPNLRASFPAVMGRATVVMGTPSGSGTRGDGAIWTVTVVHEMFHVFAYNHGEPEKVAALAIGPPREAQWQLDYPFPYHDERVRRAMHVAGCDLYRCIESSADLPYESGVADEAVHTLGDLLDAAFPGRKDLAYARFVATKEGVARYFEYRVAELAARDYSPTPDYAKLDGTDAFAMAWDNFYKAMPFQIKHLGNVSQSRSEFYSLGLGLALVLDRIEPEWQKRYFESGVWLDGQLHDAAQRVKAASSCPVPAK